MKLSKNFTREEFEKSQTAIRHGIINSMDTNEIKNAIALCENVLQPVRNYFGITVITSGFRSKALNEQIGGSDTSQHIKGQAADIEVPGVSTYKLAEWISKNIDFDQLILEYYTPSDPSSGWVHVSYNTDGNRKSVLTATRNKHGKTEYQNGLVVDSDFFSSTPRVS